MRLIDADALLEELKEYDFSHLLENIYDLITKAPTVHREISTIDFLTEEEKDGLKFQKNKHAPMTTVQREGLLSVPPPIFMTIARLLDNEINRCAENGANSVSMPDDLVELAAWLHAAPTDTE